MSPEETKKKQLFFSGRVKGQTQNIVNKSHSNQSSYDGRVSYKKASVASQKQKDLFAEVFGKRDPEACPKEKGRQRLHAFYQYLRKQSYHLPQLVAHQES